MDQTTARKTARQWTYDHKDTDQRIYIATTVCALRGQFEQGPDANKWIVVNAAYPDIVAE